MPAYLLASAVGDQEVVSSAAETSLFSTTVVGGTMGPDSLLVGRVIADVFNDTGVGQTATLRWKFGGTTIHTFTTISLADAGATNRYSDLQTMFLFGENSVTTQGSMMEHRQSGAIAPGPPSGTAGGNDHNTSTNRVISVNSSTDQTLELTVQLSAADAQLKFKRMGVWVEHESASLPSTIGAGTELLALVIPGPGQGLARNTTAETSILTQVIPGGKLGTGNLLVVNLIASCRNMSGGNAQWWYNLYLGGTQMFAPVTGVNSAFDPLRYAFPVEYWIGAAGATNAQRFGMIGQTVSSTPGFGEGTLTNGGSQMNNSRTTGTVDMSTDQTFEVKVDFSVATPEIDCQLHAATFQVIKA